MRLDLSTLLPYISRYIEYRDWMREDSPYVAFKQLTPGSWTGKQRSRFDTSETVKQYVRDAKRREGCVVCGEDDPCCLHFHHRYPETKSFDLSRAGKYPLEVVKEEIAKCDVLCANCHAKVHAKRITRLDQWIERQEKSIE